VQNQSNAKIGHHRGARGYEPEYPYWFSKAIDLQGDQLDVHLSADGELMVIHDEN
jgi:glycerophosphoryl diester phosphodiesterase